MFSVVIPLYNRRDTIAAAIKSVQDQTFQDFEIIVVDDGSTDHPEEVIAAIGEPRLRLLRQENRGGSAARNTGIDAARGRYIAFLDSDDLFLVHHLERAATHVRLAPKDCLYSQVIVDRGGGTSFLKPPRAIGAEENISDYLLRRRGFVQTSTLIVPLNLAQRTKYDPSLSYGQDTDFAIRLVANGGRLFMLPQPGAIWRDSESPGRLSSRTSLDQRAAWLDRIRSQITKKAYLGDLGWTVAKGNARQKRILRALSLYANATFCGAYSPKVALAVLLQILLAPGRYRRLADKLAKLGLTP
jgi:glycosyltransferase involved in cell wall biosynthesis